MQEKLVKVNGVNIAYQLHGIPSNPTILLIHGLSTPLTGWPIELINLLVAANFQVLLLDNRDIGRSEDLNHLGLPNLVWTLFKYKMGRSLKVPYQLHDMAKDVSALIAELNLSKVHAVGASMGGMIAQLLAIHHPQQIKTLTSIMSTTGNPELPTVHRSIRPLLISKPKSRQFEDVLNHHVSKWRAIESPDYPAASPYLQNYVQSMLQRGIPSRGAARQFLAILAAENREPALSKITTPSLVIHGDSDKLVHVAGGRATAESIPNSKLKIYPGMGHDLPVQLIPSIASEIIQHAREHH